MIAAHRDTSNWEGVPHDLVGEVEIRLAHVISDELIMAKGRKPSVSIAVKTLPVVIRYNWAQVKSDVIQRQRRGLPHKLGLIKYGTSRSFQASPCVIASRAV